MLTWFWWEPNVKWIHQLDAAIAMQSTLQSNVNYCLPLRIIHNIIVVNSELIRLNDERYMFRSVV